MNQNIYLYRVNLYEYYSINSFYFLQFFAAADD